MTVGSQRLSRESVSKKITSCSFIKSSSSYPFSNTSLIAYSLLETACPGIGIFIVTPLVYTTGNTSSSLLAAIGAFKLSSIIESSKVKRHCLTGLEYDTFPESTKVIFL